MEEQSKNPNPLYPTPNTQYPIPNTQPNFQEPQDLPARYEKEVGKCLPKCESVEVQKRENRFGMKAWKHGSREMPKCESVEVQ